MTSGQHGRQRWGGSRQRHEPDAYPPPVVANGEFSFAGSGGVSMTGKILSPTYASGSINMASCVSSGQWTADKK